ncbi:dUTP diphosphatase [Fictibacillus sp. 5RED26]|jgi:dimeric dUTPase (all-alpha-NTP-PPase superfamily)|uniref:dUTP diphosphatase n=1 Tax=unclassified Fictibacillus TaxID=2644029 RepID=UPI0018CDB2A6|nr:MULTISPECIES: dUTP diphosphatase [unclassified Fictibacillus]MBH0157783.1 dUTP diphosphatase [Fictibacillus sp. 5RED26]MBH0163385.1 dUTP diphosphatase [Fictibacillus sp. 7GRE50]
MKIKELFSMQNELNMRIVKEHKLDNSSLFEQRRLAFLVELGELANETRCFKYWSKRPASEKEVILEEYVDGLHFVLSIGLDLGFKEVEITTEVDLGEKMDKIDINTLFLTLYQSGSKSLLNEEFQSFFDTFLGLGVKLGFSFEEIEEAYFAKNRVNHERQDTGY